MAFYALSQQEQLCICRCVNIQDFTWDWRAAPRCSFSQFSRATRENWCLDERVPTAVALSKHCSKAALRTVGAVAMLPMEHLLLGGLHLPDLLIGIYLLVTPSFLKETAAASIVLRVSSREQHLFICEEEEAAAWKDQAGMDRLSGFPCFRKNVCRWMDSRCCEGCRREERLKTWHSPLFSSSLVRWLLENRLVFGVSGRMLRGSAGRAAGSKHSHLGKHFHQKVHSILVSSECLLQGLEIQNKLSLIIYAYYQHPNTIV